MTVSSLATAGVVYIPSGPISGKWHEGDSIVVAPGVFVPSGEVLLIERDTRIFFEGSGRLEVEGVLTVQGDAAAHVYIYSMDGWRGIRLHGSTGWHLLRYVEFSTEAGTARQCIEVSDAGLDMRGCILNAAETSFRVNGGELHVQYNKFTTTHLYSKTVVLNGLDGFASVDCEFAQGNIFRNNYLKAEVPALTPGQPTDPFSMTAGLWVDYSTNICLSSNDISVRAPLTVVGVRFGNTPEFGDQMWELDQATVYAESTTKLAIGVLNEVDGDLDVSRMTITVRGAEGHLSSCFFATRTAYIRINSTTTVMGRPTDIYFNTSSAGRIDADYLIKWTISGATVSNRPSPLSDHQMISRVTLDDTEVNIGDSVWTANPRFAMIGEWGEWDTREEIGAFFSLTEISPCIDRGDPELGMDPDNTRLDIGRYYYHQQGTQVGDLPELVKTSVLGAAYPNPFNPTTVIPIELAHAGLLRVTVWDVLGRIVFESVQSVSSAGLQNVHFNAFGLSSGTYLAQAELNDEIIGSQRLLLVK